MKHKGQRDIPDFATKRPTTAAPLAATAATPRKVAPAPAHQPIKPQATSAKSGRRGQ